MLIVNLLVKHKKPNSDTKLYQKITLVVPLNQFYVPC